MSAPQDGTHRATHLAGHVGAPMVQQVVSRGAGPWLFALPKNGGYTHADEVQSVAQNNDARAVARIANMRGDCFTIGRDGILQSAGVVVARLANCFVVPDRSAKVFGIHLAKFPGQPAVHEFSRAMFRDMRAPGCYDWYIRQPEAATNAIAFVSWDDMERDCK
jgi:hypothetical protein